MFEQEAPDLADPNEKPKLKRILGLYPATAIVVGAVIGSGIFTSPSAMARVLPNAPLLLGVWLVTGIITLFGALTQSELIGQMPRTGGLYEYFREIYGERIGFLYGWANFTIAGSGAIAAISYVFANYLSTFVPLPEVSQALAETPVHLPMLGDIFPLANIGIKLVGVLLIATLTTINIRGVKIGATLQSISTTSKVMVILAVVAIAFIGGAKIGSTSHWFGSASSWSGSAADGGGLSGYSLLSAITLAMSGAFWAYDGWGNIAYIGGEVREPSKTIPRAIILGTLTFITVYMLMNMAYLYILPVGEMGAVANDRVASAMTAKIVGGTGAALIALLIMLSTFDTTNSSVLTNARVYFAMSRDRIFYSKAQRIHPKFETPHVSLLMQGTWAAILLVSGSFELITDMYVFVNWMLYVLMGIGVFILRYREPNRVRPFRVPGYPVIPAVFVLFAVTYVVLTLVSDVSAFRGGEQPLLKSVTGLLLVLSGLPFYYFWKRKSV